MQERLARQRGLPRGLHIEGTNVCNAKCVFCAYPQMKRPKQTMAMPLFRRIIDEYVAMGGRNVSLTPIVGDPFVDPYLFERLDDLHRRPEIVYFYFYTNAILMKPGVSERLMAYGDKLRVKVSMGGFDRATYRVLMGVDQFERVQRRIEAFIDAKRRTGSSIGFVIAVRCPSEKCAGAFWETIGAWRDEGLLTIELADGFGDGFDTWAGKISRAELRRVGLRPMPKPYKRGACEMLYTKPVILADGRVNACACRDVEAELIVDDVERSSLAAIWNGKGIDDIIDRHERGDFPDVCRRCTFYISVYNQRRSTLLQPQLNWRDEPL
jgi:MoaA/NifB/PqqE/SkfB family radical SAM enzyme